MLAHLLLGALALSCRSEPQGCDRYVDDADAWGACTLAERGYAGEVEATCADLGPLESTCRQEWVRLQIPAPRATEQLMADCGRFDECRLMVIDLRGGSPLERAQLCALLGERTRDDCMHHSLREWATSTPTQEESEFVLETVEPAFASAYVALAAGCKGVGSCPKTGPAALPCAAELAAVRDDPALCRSKDELAPKGGASPLRR